MILLYKKEKLLTTQNSLSRCVCADAVEAAGFAPSLFVLFGLLATLKINDPNWFSFSSSAFPRCIFFSSSNSLTILYRYQSLIAQVCQTVGLVVDEDLAKGVSVCFGDRA